MDYQIEEQMEAAYRNLRYLKIADIKEYISKEKNREMEVFIDVDWQVLLLIEDPLQDTIPLFQEI